MDNNRNYYNKSNSYTNKSNNNGMMGMVIKIIILFIILYVLYWLYSFYTERKVRMKDVREIIKNAKSGKSYSIIKSKEIPTSSFSNEYAISFWLYIDDYNYKFKKQKNILLKGSKDGVNANPEIYLNPIENNMTVKIKLQSESYKKDTFNDTSSGFVDGFEDVMGSDASAIRFQEFDNVLDKVSNNNVEGQSSVQYSDIDGSDFFKLVSGNTIESFQDISLVDTSNSELESSSGNAIVSDARIVNNMELTVEEYKKQTRILYSLLCELFNKLLSDKVVGKMLEAYNSFFDTLIELINVGSRGGDIATIQPSSPTIETRQIMADNNNLVIAFQYMMRFQMEADDAEKEKLNNQKKVFNTELKEKMAEMNCNLDLDIEDTQISIASQLIRLFKEKGKKIIVKLAQKIDNNLVNNNPELDGFDMCMVENIKLQRWTHIVVSVYNNIVDVYCDGKLCKSSVLKGFPQPNTNDLHLSLDGGFSGKMAKTNFINAAISQNEAYELYRAGPVYRDGLWDTITGWFD